MQSPTFTQKLKNYAKAIGIDLIGIAPAEFDEEGAEKLKNFIDEKRHGNMQWLEDYQKRVTPQALLPDAKSVIVIAINYYRESPPTPADEGRVARYAYGRDYHKVLKNLLKKLSAFIETHYAVLEKPGDKFSRELTRICVDASPLLEKSYAVKAGLGFIGKNTTLITPEFGSFVLLGEIITTLELEYDQPRTGTCGTCTRCLDACPTQAIISPGKLDATHCISYLTIEHKGPIPQKFHKPMANLIFGCDICQEVCPYNKAFAKPLQLEAFKETKIAGSSIPLEEILAIDSDEKFLQRFAGSPLMRAKREGLQRNAKIAIDNKCT